MFVAIKFILPFGILSIFSDEKKFCSIKYIRVTNMNSHCSVILNANLPPSLNIFSLRLALHI